MLKELIDSVAELGQDATETIYLINIKDKKPDSTEVSRINGSPIGVTETTWPKDDDGEPFEHLFTLDLTKLPEIRKRGLEKYSAAALFVQDRCDHTAFSPYSPDISVVLLTDEDLKIGELDKPLRISDEDEYEAKPQSYVIEELQVPSSLFELEDAEEPDEKLEELEGEILDYCDAICSPIPILIDKEEHFEQFLCVFDESFIDINCGDGGFMFMYSDTAFVSE